MALLRRVKVGWFPASVLTGMVLCWYLLHLIQNTPGRSLEDLDKDRESAVVLSSHPDLRIIVLTYNRSESLKRLLKSLTLADYLGDKVALDIWVDRSTNGKVCNKTAEVAMQFKFKLGEKSAYIRGKHAGLIQQWLYTWKFSMNPKEICVILEDDITVSPHFYQWLKLVHSTYKSDNRISGFTLQGAGIIHSGEKALEKIIVPERHMTYLYSIPGTWGFSPKVDQWIEFIRWYEEASMEKDFHPIIPNDIATEWYQQNRKRGDLENMWSMWLIHFNWKFTKYVLYPNIQPFFQGFSFNWKDPGLNSYGHDVKPQSGALVKKWSEKLEKLPLFLPTVLTNGTVLYEMNK